MRFERGRQGSLGVKPGGTAGGKSKIFKKQIEAGRVPRTIAGGPFANLIRWVLWIRWFNAL